MTHLRPARRCAQPGMNCFHPNHIRTAREMLDEQTGEEIGKLLETLKIARNAEIARKTEIADPRSRSKL